MISRQELEGKWKQVKGQIREQWGQLTDDQLEKAKGSTDQLLGVIQEKTGQSRREVEDYIQNLLSAGKDAAKQASDATRNYTEQYAEQARQFADTANQKFKEGYRQVEQQVSEGCDNAQQLVRSRPMESVLACFGAGLVSGVVMAMMMRSSRH